jgi:hypothetical protein
MFLLLLTALLFTSARAEEADGRPESPDVVAVREAHTKLLQAYASVNVDDLTALLEPSKRLLIFHPRGDLSFDSLPSVRWGIERMMSKVGPSTWLNESHSKINVVGDVAWHTYYMTMEWDGLAEPIRTRGTEIWVRHAAGWRLVHAHWSERHVTPDDEDGEPTDEDGKPTDEEIELPQG